MIHWRFGFDQGRRLDFGVRLLDEKDELLQVVFGSIMIEALDRLFVSLDITLCCLIGLRSKLLQLIKAADQTLIMQILSRI